jgi:DNA polymerase III sliding clamp (beta) subunit (PCNA family)
MKDVAFDPKYMREALRALPADSTVEIGFVSKEKSFVLKQGDYTHLIVPMT